MSLHSSPFIPTQLLQSLETCSRLANRTDGYAERTRSVMILTDKAGARGLVILGKPAATDDEQSA